MILSGSIAAKGKVVTAAHVRIRCADPSQLSGLCGISGLEILVGFAAVILGILALLFESSGILVLVGFIAMGAALVMVSAISAARRPALHHCHQLTVDGELATTPERTG